MDEDSVKLVRRFEEGDERAASELFNRYVNQLVALARSRLSKKLQRRVDPEDIVQSAYQTFFIRASAGQVVLRRSGELWRLLSAITLNKIHGQVERHSQQKRSLVREINMDVVGQGFKVRADAISRNPSPDEAAALHEELEQLVRDLPLLERSIFEMMLQGKANEEISVAVSRSERTVRRLATKLERRLVQRLLG
jgi:RNA polymerase sigma factor (sigma-70 family)